RELVRELTLASRKALCDENDYLLTNYLKKHRKDDNVAVNEGIARFNNERFFQYIIARHLVVAKGYLVNLEKQTFDMTLYRESARTSPVALCEIKRWMSEFGEREIPSIVSDLKKLRDSKQSNTFEIVITLEREKSWPE